MDAAGGPEDGHQGPAPLFCRLCFGDDHSRASCRLVVPAALAQEDALAGDEAEAMDVAGGAVEAPPVEAEDEEEEDPEELVFEEDFVVDGAAEQPAAAGSMASLAGSGAAASDGEDGFIPITDAADYLSVPASGSEAPDEEDLAAPARPDTVAVYMPFVNLRLFDNLAYAFVNPPMESPDSFISQAADLGCGPDRVSLFPSSEGARLAVFSTPPDRENAVNNGPFIGFEASIFFRRHDETENRFLFEHESRAALSCNRYPMEHWRRNHISHSSGPFANPHAIDPICLAGVDFEAVLVTVKAESISDIPFTLAVKNHCSSGSFSDITIVGFEDLAPGSEGSSGPDLNPIPEAFSSGEEDEDFLQFEGGTSYAESMEILGIPPPLVPHGQPSSAAPAAPIVARALANAPPLPIVSGSPILSKPARVEVKLRLGFFDVLVVGSDGAQLSFRLPLRRASSDPGCRGLLVANFATASAGLINSIALVGPLRRPTLSVRVLARGSAPAKCMEVPLATAEALVLGRDPELAEAQESSRSTAALTSPTLPAPTSPVISSLTSELSPVRATRWAGPAVSAARPARRCSRLAGDKAYVSIVDKAVQRKKALNEGSSAPAPKPRRGELLADDLLAIAVEDGAPLQSDDILALARACDLPTGSLGLGLAIPSPAGSPC